MIPIDPTRVNRCFLFKMNKTLILIDAGFLSKLTKHLGKGKHIKFDIEVFSKKNS